MFRYIRTKKWQGRCGKLRFAARKGTSVWVQAAFCVDYRLYNKQGMVRQVYIALNHYWMLHYLLTLVCLMSAMLTSTFAQTALDFLPGPEPVSKQQPMRLVKGMVLPMLLVNNVSVGYERQRGRSTSWNATVGAAAGFFPVSGSYGRWAARLEHRWYMLPLERMLEGSHLNPFVAGCGGFSYHESFGVGDELGSDAYRSANMGIMLGQQIFSGRMSIDLAAGLRAHAGTTRRRTPTTVTAWRSDQWLSPIMHFQVGWVINGSKRTSKRKLER